MAKKGKGVMIGGTEYKSIEHAGRGLIFGMLGLVGIVAIIIGFFLVLVSTLSGIIVLLIGGLLAYYGFKKVKEQKIGER